MRKRIQVCLKEKLSIYRLSCNNSIIIFLVYKEAKYRKCQVIYNLPLLHPPKMWHQYVIKQVPVCQKAQFDFTLDMNHFSYTFGFCAILYNCQTIFILTESSHPKHILQGHYTRKTCLSILNDGHLRVYYTLIKVKLWFWHLCSSINSLFNKHEWNTF